MLLGSCKWLVWWVRDDAGRNMTMGWDVKHVIYTATGYDAEISPEKAKKAKMLHCRAAQVGPCRLWLYRRGDGLNSQWDEPES